MAGQLTTNRSPIRPTNSDNPLLSSASAAGEHSTDREGGAELLQGLFGDEVEIGEVEEDEDQDVDDNILAEQDMPNGPMSESPGGSGGHSATESCQTLSRSNRKA